MKYPIGYIAILLGVISLGLSIYLLEERTTLEDMQRQQATSTAGLSFSIGSKTMTVGASDHHEERQEELRQQEQRVKRLRLGTLVLALAAIALVPFSLTREKSKAIVVFAAILPLLALTWQYIAVGIAIGVGLAVFLMVLGAIGGALS